MARVYTCDFITGTVLLLNDFHVLTSPSTVIELMQSGCDDFISFHFLTKSIFVNGLMRIWVHVKHFLWNDSFYSSAWMALLCGLLCADFKSFFAICCRCFSIFLTPYQIAVDIWAGNNYIHFGEKAIWKRCVFIIDLKVHSKLEDLTDKGKFCPDSLIILRKSWKMMKQSS